MSFISCCATSIIHSFIRSFASSCWHSFIPILHGSWLFWSSRLPFFFLCHLVSQIRFFVQSPLSSSLSSECQVIWPASSSPDMSEEFWLSFSYDLIYFSVFCSCSENIVCFSTMLHLSPKLHLCCFSFCLNCLFQSLTSIECLATNSVPVALFLLMQYMDFTYLYIFIHAISSWSMQGGKFLVPQPLV